MKYAVKLALKPKASWYSVKKTRTLGLHVLEDKHGVVRRYVPKHIYAAITQSFSSDIAAACIGVNYSTIHPLKPHIHTEENCVINVYEKASSAKTVFYEGKIARLNGVTQDNGNKYYLVDHNLLDAVENFTAQDNDVWLLNTKQPHAVIGEDSPRKLIQIFLDMPFEEAKAKLL